MHMKVLVLGSYKTAHRIANALEGTSLETVYRNDVSEAISLLKKEKFDLALIDGYMDNLEATCYRLTWLCRTPIALVINGTENDWDLLRNLELDGFIPEEADQMDLENYFLSISSHSDNLFGNAKILIVEDDEQTQEAFRLSFNIYWPEAQVSFTGLGQEGIKLAQDLAPDGILLDIKLPDIYGFDVLRDIRAFSQVPVIIVSATRNHEDVARCINLGANDYLVKPFKQWELMSRVRQLVNQRAAVS
jgi:DNA-binding response OmpR family regulator